MKITIGLAIKLIKLSKELERSCVVQEMARQTSEETEIDPELDAINRANLVTKEGWRK